MGEKNGRGPGACSVGKGARWGGDARVVVISCGEVGAKLGETQGEYR